jgi:hypothetical protein
MSNLTATLRSLASDHVSLPKIATYYAEALARGFNNTVAYRKSGMLPESQVIDLYFKDFITDQIGTVRRAYQHFDMELSDTAVQGMQSFLDDNPIDKHGKHVYSFADTEMDEEKLRELFHNYQSYFDIPFEAV